jgi:hypothetical protein
MKPWYKLTLNEKVAYAYSQRLTLLTASVRYQLTIK